MKSTLQQSHSRLLAALALLFGAGCFETTARNGQEQKPAGKAASGAVQGESTPSQFPLTVKDNLNRTVVLPRAPQRIVSLAPKNTELLFAIGAGAQVVGVTSQCNYPPEALDCERVGVFSGKSLSLEKIVSLEPDLILSAGEFHRAVVDELERLGLVVAAMGADSLTELYDEIQLMGRMTGHDDQSADLVGRMRDRVERVRESTRHISSAKRVTVYYQVWDAPLTAAGPGSFIGEMIELAGGINIIADRAARYPQISEEALLQLNPDVILAPTSHAASLNPDDFRNKPGWRDLRAVKTNRIHLIDGDLVSRCGPRLVDALEAMAQALYAGQPAAPAGSSTPDAGDFSGKRDP
jgi:iron complex transport system substrate-binding protein